MRIRPFISLPPASAQAIWTLRYFLVAAAGFTLPLPEQLGVFANSITVIGLTATSLVLFISGQSLARPTVMQVLVATLFLLFLGHLWQSPFPEQAGFEVEKKLSWIALPLAFALAPPKATECSAFVFYFVLALVLEIIFSYFLASIAYLREPAPYHFWGINILYSLSLHRVYMSLHLLVAVLLLQFHGTALLDKWRWPIMVALAAFGLQLASRTGVITAAILCLFFTVVYIFKGRPRLGLAILVLMVAGGVIMMRIGYLNQALHALVAPPRPALEIVEDNAETSVDIRRILWRAAWQEIKKAPWAGHGTGSTEALLKEQFKTMNFTLGMKGDYNAHNQYLQTWLEIGLPGLVLLLAVLLWPAWMGARQKRKLPAILVFCFAMALTSESMLSTQKGTVFICLVLLLFADENLANGSSKEDSRSLENKTPKAAL